MLCSDEEFNKVFQRECEDQWDNPQDYITVEYPVGGYNLVNDHRNYIRIYKEDVEQEFV